MQKRNFLVFALAFLLTVAMILSLTGCGGGGSTAKFVGKWIPEIPDPTVSGDPPTLLATTTMELNSDGTGLYHLDAGPPYGYFEMDFTWKIEAGRFIVSISDSSEEFSASVGYELKGSKLTLTDEDGNSQIYNKE